MITEISEDNSCESGVITISLHWNRSDSALGACLELPCDMLFVAVSPGLECGWVEPSCTQVSTAYRFKPRADQ